MKMKVLVAQSCPTLCNPVDCTSVCGILQARTLEWVAIAFSRGIFPTQGWNPGFPHGRQILYQLSHQGSPRIPEWVASLSLLQQIFPTQGLNWVLPHCRQILHQLSHQGSLRILEWVANPFSSVSSNPGIELGSPALQVDSLPTELPGKPLTDMLLLLLSHISRVWLCAIP